MATRDEYREWLKSTGKHEGKQLGEWAQNLVRSFGLEGALDLLSVTGDSNLYGVDLRRSPWAGRPWLKEMVRAARTTDHRLSRSLYLVAQDPSWTPAAGGLSVKDFAAEVVAYIDRSVDNVEDLDSSTAWRNDEVLEVLRDIRSLLLTGEVVR